MNFNFTNKVLVMSRYMIIGVLFQCIFYSVILADNTIAQGKSINDIYVRLELNGSIENIFQEIENATGFKFSYNKTRLNLRKNVSVEAESKTLAEVLISVSKQTDFKFKRINDIIFVAEREKDDKAFIEEHSAFQKVTVTGKVTSDENPEGLPGVNIVVKGASVGTVTDIDGNYAIEVSGPESTLIFSSVGFVTEEINVGSRSVIDIVLLPDVTALQEIVVVGYGVQEKRDLTGAVGSVNNERLEGVSAANLVSSLQGAVSGVSINTSFGTPGGGSSILIRGLNSINASNDPLIVVDGIPGASINDIHPSQIESIDVLKDAASTSIYGSRGTNGVIIVTTKSGNPGKLSLSYDGYYAISEPLRKVDVLSPDQYVAKRREIYRMQNNLSFEEAQNVEVDDIFGASNELNMYNLGRSYDWQEEIVQFAPQHSHNISLSGGNEKTKYYMAASLLDQQGIVKSSSFSQYSVRGRVSGDVTPWLQLGTNVFLTKSKQDIVPDGVFVASYQISPLGQKYIDENNPGQYTLYPMDPDNHITNPFTDMSLEDYYDRTKLLNGTYAQITFFKDLKYRFTVNSIFDYERNNFFAPFYTKLVESFEQFENARIRDWDRQYVNLENLLTYTKTLGNHELQLTGVFSTEDYQQDYVTAFAKNFGSDYYSWTALQLGQVDFHQVGSAEEKWFLESIVGRLNYSFQDKYLVQITGRRDRSSKFAPENRTAFFPGAAVGWRISHENFMQSLNWIDDLKARVSYAVTGNQGIGYRSIYNTGGKVRYTLNTGEVFEGFDQTSLGNKNLKWEQSAQLNVGLDFTMFNGKFSGSVEYYNTKTTDLLMERSIPFSNGFERVLANIGSVNNRGVEVALNGVVVEGNDFSLKTTLTYSRNQNEIVELYGDGVDDVANSWFIGEPLGVIYDYVFDGILQPGEEPPAHMDNLVGTEDDGKNIVPGEVKVKDIGSYETLESGAVVPVAVPDGRIDAADRTIIGQTQPKWYGGLGLQFAYKKFNASFFINHVQGTLRRIPLDVAQRTHMLDLPYYTDENPSTQYSRPAWPNVIDEVSRGSQFGHLTYYQSGTYTRLQDATISYTLDNLLGNAQVNSVTFYVTAQNLFTITDFEGYDPSIPYVENQTEGDISRLAGYPTTKNWIAGVRVNF